MLFTGISEHTIDAKQRLAIPSKHRYWGDGVGPAWFCMPLPDGRLRLYPEAVFKTLSEQDNDSLTLGGNRAEFETAFYGYTERLDMDSAHRVVLPKSHLLKAKIGNEVVLVGTKRKLELWDKSVWLATDEGRFGRMNDLMEKVEAERRGHGGRP